MRGILVILTCLLLGSCASPMDQDPLPKAPATSEPQIVSPSREVRLEPAVTPRQFTLGGSDAPVVKLQLQGDALVPPDDPQVLGWWGTKAGKPEGTTLLVGHTVHSGGGFLDDLEKVPVGSSVGVSGLSYSVVSNRVMSKERLAQIAPRLFSQTGPHRLVVVTCEDYNPATGHYSSNVVMVAK